jgi:prolipoprotein diacylglyceryl transferase
VSLPTLTWDVDPVFFRAPPTPLWPLLAAAGAIGLGLVVRDRVRGRRDGAGWGWTLILIAGIGLLAWGDRTVQPELRWYSLLFVGVFMGGYSLLRWQIVRGGGEEQDASDFIIYGVVGVLGGARLGHVIFYDLEKAIRDPLWVLQIWTGGLASHGAVIGLIVAMWLFTRRRGVPFLEGSDRFAFSAALGATLVRIGNLINSEILGKPTDGSWGMLFPRVDHPPILRHPTQLYEAALGTFVLGALWLWDRALGREKRPRAALIAMFFALYFPGRFVIEIYKEHQTKEPTPYLTMGQYLSIPGMLLGFYGLWWAFKHRLPVGWERAEREEEAQDEEPAEEEAGEQTAELDPPEDEEAPAETGEAEAAGGDPDVDEEIEMLRRRREPEPAPKKRKKKRKQRA